MHKKRIETHIKNLQHPDADIRRSAAEALGEGDVRAVYPLIKALCDENYGVQDAAIHSLMKIRDEATAYMVLPLLRESAFLRNTAILILRELGDIAVPLLRGILKDRDEDVRKFALDLIQDIRKCDYQDDIVAVLENDPNPNVRAAAAKTLGRLGYKGALNSLLSALNDDEWVAFSALEALAHLGMEESAGPVSALLDSRSETLRFAAAETLGRISSRQSVDALTAHFRRTEGPEKEVVLQSLVRLGAFPEDESVEQMLLAMLGSDDWEVCSTAVKGLSSMKSIRSIRPMIDLAGSFDPSIPDHDDKIHFIMKSVESIGCEEELISILNDRSVKYRGKSVAIECVGNLRCKRAVPALIELLNSNIRDIRRSSIESLGKIDGESARHMLLDAISDHDGHVRKSAIISLGKIGDKNAFDPLFEMLKIEKYSDVIDELIRALLFLDPEEFCRRKDEFSPEIRSHIASLVTDFTERASC
jgi:HEAT repeat protein